MPETRVLDAIRRTQVRQRATVVLDACSAGLAAAAALLAVGRLVFEGAGGVAVALTVSSGAVVFAVVARRGWRRCDWRAAAAALETSIGTADNLVWTAAELTANGRAVSPAIRDEVLRQAAASLDALAPGRAVSLGRSAATCALVIAGALLTAWRVPFQVAPSGTGPGPLRSHAAPSIAAVRIRVQPPAYTGRPGVTLIDAGEVTVLAGSRVHVEVATTAAAVTVTSSDAAPVLTLVPGGDGFAGDLVATRSTSMTLQADGATGSPRWLTLVVAPDLPPTVRVTRPGRDLTVAPPGGRIGLEIEGADDIGMAAMDLVFTRGAGGGESVTFTEGRVPLSMTRTDSRHWVARADWRLDGLGLEAGDVLVYRAVVRDTNPAGTAVPSESFLIDIGRVTAIAAAGFAVPAEEKRYAVSQQMVIYKTEQLQADRRRHVSDWLTETRGLAVEQRMVRAEVVFLGGGEVEDEEAEAASSSELTEGRLQNTGRAELLRAVTAMSRAEARLNEGDTVGALVFERAALDAMERAFDRRRYFLRTVPERARIDVSRRLTGPLGDARSWSRAPSVVADAPGRAAARELMAALAANAGAGPDGAALAVRLVAVAPGDGALREAATALATASSDDRPAAARRAMRALSAHMLPGLRAPALGQLPEMPLAGYLAEQMARGRGGPR